MGCRMNLSYHVYIPLYRLNFGVLVMFDIDDDVIKWKHFPRN